MTEEKADVKYFDSKAVIVFDVTDNAIADLEKAWPASAIPKDLSVKEDYKLVQEGVATLRKLRSKVEARRKELKADALAYGKRVDATANDIKERLLAIEEPLKLAKTTYDEKVEIEKREKVRLEEERVQGIADKIATIRASIEANISSDSVTIKGVIDGLYSLKPEEWADEFCDKALVAIAETTNKLEELFAMKEQSEKAAEIAAEHEKKRLADEEKATKKREDDLAADAVKLAADKAEIKKEQDKLQADKDALAKDKADLKEEKEAAAQKIIDDNAAAAKKIADDKAAEADKKRLADIEKKKKADAKKAKKEVEKRTNEAVKAIDSFVIEYGDDHGSLALAIEIVELIKAGKVPNVTFE